MIVDGSTSVAEDSLLVLDGKPEIMTVYVVPADARVHSLLFIGTDEEGGRAMKTLVIVMSDVIATFVDGFITTTVPGSLAVPVVTNNDSMAEFLIAGITS